MTRLLIALIAILSLSGCTAVSRMLCTSHCHADTHTSSNLVDFLYPNGSEPPAENASPVLHVPLRVGLAFLPTQQGANDLSLDAARKEQLLSQIRQRFADRKFVANIIIIPEYYLADRHGFSGLEGVQRLYGVDVMALVSFDQQTHLDDNEWSLSYLTIVGAYVVKGSRHDISTLVDLAVIDPATKSLLLRAGGTDTRHGNTTLFDQARESREASGAGFTAATQQMIDNFDVELEQFEAQVRAGQAPVRIVTRNRSSGGSGGSGGGGAFDWATLTLLAGVYALRRISAHR